MARIQFEACLAHEITHAALAEASTIQRPPVIEEGMAEFVAWQYLNHCVRHPMGKQLAQAMILRQGDEYAEGLKVIRRQVELNGFPSVWSAIAEGRFNVR